MSPKERTHQRLKEAGYAIANTEHWNKWAKCRQDLFGFIDTLAVKREHLLAVQITDGDHHAAAVAKIIANSAAPLLAWHMEIEVWSWSKRRSGKRLKSTGKLDPRPVWTLRQEPLTSILRKR